MVQPKSYRQRSIRSAYNRGENLITHFTPTEAAAEGSFTVKELELKYVEYGGRCVYCGDEDTLTPDHVMPLSRGGSNKIDNIVPACYACNVKKGTMTSEEFFVCIDAGKESSVLTRRYINEHPEIVGGGV